jgi:hypothetical protein
MTALREEVARVGRTLLTDEFAGGLQGGGASAGSLATSLPAAFPLSALVTLVELRIACADDWPAHVPRYDDGEGTPSRTSPDMLRWPHPPPIPCATGRLVCGGHP